MVFIFVWDGMGVMGVGFLHHIFCTQKNKQPLGLVDGRTGT